MAAAAAAVGAGGQAKSPVLQNKRSPAAQKAHQSAVAAVVLDTTQLETFADSTDLSCPMPNPSSTCIGTTLARDFLRLLPEEGCAVDDLSGERSASALSTATLRGANGVFTLDGGDRDDEWHLRTFFRAPSDDGAARRVRVSLRTDAAGSGPAPRKPRVRVALERRWSEAPALPEPTTTVGDARTGIAASWLSDKMAKARCFGDAAAPGADAEGVVWLPGAVGVRFADNVVRVVCRAGDTVLGCDRVFGFDGAPGPGDPLVFEEFGEAWEPPTTAY